MSLIIVPVTIGGGKTGIAKTGDLRYLPDSDGLCEIRKAARASVYTISDDHLPVGKSREETVTEVVRLILNPPQSVIKGADVRELDLPGEITIRLVTPRAARLGSMNPLTYGAEVKVYHK